MKKYKNGKYMELSPEEIAKTEEETACIPTDTERLEALEMAMLELAEVIANG